MRFDELVHKVLAVYDQYAEENSIRVDEDYALLKLVEEIGELAQAVIIRRGMCRAVKRLPPVEAQRNVAAELADILGLTILVADRMDVDLAEAIRKKWLHFLDKPRGRASQVVEVEKVKTIAAPRSRPSRPASTRSRKVRRT